MVVVVMMMMMMMMMMMVIAFDVYLYAPSLFEFTSMNIIYGEKFNCKSYHSLNFKVT